MIPESEFKRLEETSLEMRRLRKSVEDMSNAHRREILRMLDRTDIERDEHYRLLALIRMMQPESDDGAHTP